MLGTLLSAKSQIMNNPNADTSLAPAEQLTLTQEWDKIFHDVWLLLIST